jgi:hypothetical protein
LQSKVKQAKNREMFHFDPGVKWYFLSSINDLPHVPLVPLYNPSWQEETARGKTDLPSSSIFLI